MFKKMLAALGVGGPSVDTVLSSPDTQPGRTLQGEVNIVGGDVDVDIEYVALSLVTRAELGDDGPDGAIELTRATVSGAFTLPAGQEYRIPFELAVPWESPITVVYGQQLHGMAAGVHTELAVAKAVDKTDLDAVRIHPLSSQEMVLDALAALDCSIKSSDVETGRIAGVPQRLPAFQEIEYHPPGRYMGRINEIELTFISTPHELHVVLEADRNGDRFSEGGDEFGRWHVPHGEAEGFPWADHIGSWLEGVAARVGHPGHEYGHEHDHGGGSGIGGMIAGVAGGVVGGMVLGEVIDEVGEAFFEDED